MGGTERKTEQRNEKRHSRMNKVFLIVKRENTLTAIEKEGVIELEVGGDRKSLKIVNVKRMVRILYLLYPVFVLKC